MMAQAKNILDMETSLDKIKAILKREIGLDASTIGEATINKILNSRMRNCNVDNLDDYYICLNNISGELNLLLETSVIPETWFFRDDKPFKLILEKISKQLLTRQKKPCRILCAPCSTGEEPYSIAIFLHSNGIPETAYEIQAVDISHNSINIAKQGIYNKNSFRGEKAKMYINNYFTPDNEEYVLNKNIRSSVKFKRVNIVDANTLPFKNKFDFILCRNLLIYFDMPTKEIAYKNMNNLLMDEGLLFIGHSEFGSVPEKIFSTTKRGSTFCLMKRNNNAEKIEENNFNKKNKTISLLDKKKPAAIKAFSKPEQYVPRKTNSESKPETATQKEPDTNDKDLIKQARTLADQGKLGEAESLCLEYINIYNDHEDSFFLLGLISEASGNDSQAHSFYKKALYLNPKHYESLIHLSLIFKNEGDIKASNLLKERAERTLKNNL